MLQSLTIKNIVLIASLHIPFKRGLCVLTGETGAGKSILLDSLGLALGKRADPALVRHGCEQGSVVASFDVSDNPKITTILKEQDIELDDALLLKRVIGVDGKSKAFVNGEPAPQKLLQQLADCLVEILGQHDQRGLTDASTHRGILDVYAGNGALVGHTSECYQQWKKVAGEYQELKKKAEKAREEEEYLRHVLAELHELDPQEGEEDALAEQRSFMMNREKMLQSLSEALGHLSGKHNVQSAISSAERVLHRSTAQQSGDLFEPALQALDRASVEVVEAMGAIEQSARDLEGDDASLEDTEERLFALRAAARKHNVTVDSLPEYADKVASQIGLIESQDGQLAALQKKAEEYRTNYTSFAEQLTEKRKQSSDKISKHIGKELAPLKMETAQLKVSLEALEEAHWTAHGQDAISFLVRTNSGSAFGAMGKIASGGELSRFMLAMKVVLSGVNDVPTLIFDEIDTGIGGATADAVGKRLSQLSQNPQVLCVTHQPQVASYGTQHLFIEKSTEKGETTTTIAVLNEQARKEEVARMLAGEEVTHEARAAAEKLIGAG